MKKFYLLGLALLFGMLTTQAQDVTVVDDIATYEGTDAYVYSRADGKTYVQNNLGKYERYGVYEKVKGLDIKTATGTKEVEYISAPDGAYIDLGYAPKSNTRIEAVYESTEGPDWKALYGTRFEANTQNDKEFPGITGSCYTNGNGWKAGFAFFPTNGAINLNDEKVEKGKMVYNQKVKIVQDAATGKLDIYTGTDLDKLANTIEDGPLTGDCTTSLYIFAINKHLPVIEGYNDNSDAFGANNDPCYNPYVKLYSLKIYEGETLVHDLVPVSVDGKGGLKDKADNDKIYSSSNDKDFAVSGVTVYNGKMVLNTTDGHVYKYTGSGWTDLGARSLTEIAKTDYKNMKNWYCPDGPDGHWADVFGRGDNIQWTEATQTNTFDPYVGTGGWEPLRYILSLDADADYNVSFNYSTGGWKTWANGGAGGGEVDSPVNLPFKIIDREGIEQNNGHFGTDAGWINGAKLTPEAQNETPVSVDFSTPTGIATFIVQFGVVDDGGHDPAYWFKFDNLSVKKYIYPEAYPEVNPFKSLLATLLPEAKGISEETTTTALYHALQKAISAAEDVADGSDLSAQETAANALQTALDKVKEVNVTALKATVALAEAEGVTVSGDVNTFLEEGTERSVLDNLLRYLRNARKLNAATTIDPETVEGSEPADGDYYLLNVGTGLFLNTTADWGTHISIDNPGMLITLKQDGTGNDGLPAFHISGNGWDGLNWSEEYWDKNGEHKSAFRPVKDKEKVYYWNVFDNFKWHFVYNTVDDECDGGTHYWNAVQKYQKDPAEYADDLNAQWKLVTKAQLLAAMSNATASNPVDATFMIENPSFTKFGGQETARGWTGVGSVQSADRDAFYLIEYYQSDVNLKQTISGLPAGKYQVSVNGFFRDGTADNETAKKKNNGGTLKQLASLVAINGNEEKVSALLPNVSSEAGNMPGVGDVVNGLEVANWPAQANEYFQTGLYKTTTDIIEVGDDGLLTIGIEDTNDGTDGNWVVVDNFRLTYLGATSVTATVTEKGMATFSSKYALDFTNTVGIKAYRADHAQDGTVYFEEVIKAPAETGLLLVSEGGAIGKFSIIKNADAVGDNLLTATVEDTVIGAGKYVLAQPETKEFGFYQTPEGYTSGAGKAYLTLTGEQVGSAGLAPILIFGNETTGISAAMTERGNSNMENIYNLNGQRVKTPGKGLYIMDGKKVVVK